MAAKSGPVIIKKVKKGGHEGGAHGAWKVAYADFVTAMMAFFLLLWLLSSVSQEQLEGISNYFAPQSASATTSGSGQVLGGQSIAEPGAIGNPIRTPPLVAMDLPTPSAGQGSTDAAKPNDEVLDAESADEMVKRKEQEQFQQAEETLRQAIQSIPSLKELSDSLVVDDTSEGMRIQIVDQEGLAMFPRGTAQMYEHTQNMLALVAKVIEKMPQKIAIAGHTDSTKFRGEAGYSNWELSADRANASRRALIDMGVPEDRISRVVGKAAEEPLVEGDPANPRNRRITIILMRGTGDGQMVDAPG